MITETLLNSLKSLFSSLGAKTSDNNYAVGLFDKTNGEPKGMMGMSDLASVLGVTYQRVMKSEAYTYTLTLEGESSVEIIFLLNQSGPKSCTYRFYFRDRGDSSYEHFGNNTGTSISVNAPENGVFTFLISGYSMLYVKKLTGNYSLV